jgi:hypothetical protein
VNPANDKVPQSFTTKLCGGPLDGHYVQWNHGQRDATFRNGADIAGYSVCGGYDLAFYSHPNAVFGDKSLENTPMSVLSDAHQHFLARAERSEANAVREDYCENTRYNAAMACAVWQAAAKYLDEEIRKRIA